MEVVMSDLVVETHLPPYSLRQFFDHQMRWARSTRDSRRAGYLGVALTFGLPWAIMSVLLSAGAWWSWIVLASTGLLRMILALVVGVGLLHDETVLRRLWLLPLRDLVALGVWFGSYAGHQVHWRGEVFVLENGKIRQA
jgi:ceramide glucosyltransferase